MDVKQLAVMLVIGCVAGWLAGLVVKKGGFGIIGNIVVGVIGSFLGGWLLPMCGIKIGGGEWVAPIVTATIGAIVLLVAISLIRKVAK